MSKTEGPKSYHFPHSTPKSYDDHPRQVKYGSPPPPPPPPGSEPTIRTLVPWHCVTSKRDLGRDFPRIIKMAADCKTKSKRFFQQPSLYDKARPEYSRESVKFLLEKIGAFSVAADQLFSILEVGVGTGKFTRVMCEVLRGRSVRITASDSNPKMCQAFHVLVPGVEIIQCPTERIGRIH